MRPDRDTLRELRLDHLARRNRYDAPTDVLGDRGGRDQPRLLVRERLDVPRREVVVVAVRDEDQVAGAASGATRYGSM